MGFAVTLFHPGRHEANGDAARMGFCLVKIGKKGQALQVAPGRKDDLDLAGVGRIENLLSACPETADIFRFINSGIRCVRRGARNIEARIEHARLSKWRTPTRERH